MITTLAVLWLAFVPAPANQTPIIKAQGSMSCGIAPIPPIGCTVAGCQCDSAGRNCSWKFNCR